MFVVSEVFLGCGLEVSSYGYLLPPFFLIIFNVSCFLLGDVVVHQYHIVLETRVLGFMTLGLWWGLGIYAGLTGDCCFTCKLLLIVGLFLWLWVEFLHLGFLHSFYKRQSLFTATRVLSFLDLWSRDLISGGSW